MKRSAINHLIRDAIAFFDAHQFRLPPWAFWGPADWRAAGDSCRELWRNQLGWDITDFGSGDYERRGLFLFTLRNGNPTHDRKPYAEKIMIVGEGQETPMHFHARKMEDIINRGGGRLVLECHQAAPGGGLSERPLSLAIDGVRREVAAGEPVVLQPGESICLEQGVYHRFWAEDGRVLCGEVSMVNDDHDDNCFLDPVGRFPDIVEDEVPLHLLVGDYVSYVVGEQA